MGKATKLLTILVDPAIADWPEIVKLGEQGHEVVLSEEIGRYDIVLGPRAHRMDESIRKWFPEAIAEARRIKYGPKKEGA